MGSNPAQLPTDSVVRSSANGAPAATASKTEALLQPFALRSRPTCASRFAFDGRRNSRPSGAEDPSRRERGEFRRLPSDLTRSRSRVTTPASLTRRSLVGPHHPSGLLGCRRRGTKSPVATAPLTPRCSPFPSRERAARCLQLAGIRWPGRTAGWAAEHAMTQCGGLLPQLGNPRQWLPLRGQQARHTARGVAQRRQGRGPLPSATARRMLRVTSSRATAAADSPWSTQSAGRSESSFTGSRVAHVARAAAASQARSTPRARRLPRAAALHTPVRPQRPALAGRGLDDLEARGGSGSWWEGGDPGATFARAGDTNASQQVRSATCWNWSARWNVQSTFNPWCAEIQRREGYCGVIP